ncbi:cell envelope biogenesis protein OmpA [Corallococcus praedator]|uniref:Cell envelope biogenesis protein OmpA n=1 Tax=Corallococcus praedator TaxID=2316724 RepID=A0ABX9QMR1_9BACT|nr:MULTISPECIES: substrate-binding domain-containing protein [Corallococcus]RKH19081.1 cell envelope biogenesis protein OmpA [Corallococcus sp. CA047B]RKH33186.1 cell envelope biogenesis protein OmpA [Corallococcus sp. CA031C]RKI13923.1 cell envelope biogenesis protein OmpA [Corallococcus praedator]
MKTTMKWVMSAAVFAMSAVGCGGASEATVEDMATAKQDLGPNREFYGSDTLKDAMIAASLASSANLNVQGKGSGVGEGCVRTGSAGYCTAGQQALSPMSRDFKAPCRTGERSNIIALDAVNAFVNTSNALTDISLADLRKLFFATDSAGVAIPGSCTSTLTKYRRDDLSGTTDTFKSLVGGGTFCSDVTVIADGALPAACAGETSATKCIGKLTATDANAIGYSGDSAARTGNRALSVNGIAPSVTNVRKFLTDKANAYPLSRGLFLNESTTNTRSTNERILYAWAYSAANKQAFENILVNQGFIACDTTGALKCGGVNNDGKGAGLCQ